MADGTRQQLAPILFKLRCGPGTARNRRRRGKRQGAFAIRNRQNALGERETCPRGACAPCRVVAEFAGNCNARASRVCKHRTQSIRVELATRQNSFVRLPCSLTRAPLWPCSSLLAHLTRVLRVLLLLSSSSLSARAHNAESSRLAAKPKPVSSVLSHERAARVSLPRRFCILSATHSPITDELDGFLEMCPRRASNWLRNDSNDAPRSFLLTVTAD